MMLCPRFHTECSEWRLEELKTCGVGKERTGLSGGPRKKDVSSFQTGLLAVTASFNAAAGRNQPEHVEADR